MTTPTQPDRERDAREKLREAIAINDREVDRMQREDVESHAMPFVDAYRDAIRAERDTAWRAAIEGMRKEHGAGCIEDEHGWICVCGGNDWNAALSALADRMGAE